ncbi:hypothetical protein GW17_00040674 [Ensete ventricosum]|nr:hypothetical protein GW17_00040674 [Ensete ventricosum]
MTFGQRCRGGVSAGHPTSERGDAGGGWRPLRRAVGPARPPWNRRSSQDREATGSAFSMGARVRGRRRLQGGENRWEKPRREKRERTGRGWRVIEGFNAGRKGFWEIKSKARYPLRDRSPEKIPRTKAGYVGFVSSDTSDTTVSTSGTTTGSHPKKPRRRRYESSDLAALATISTASISQAIPIIAFDAYTMASEETINAKFEAFETRMEKIQSLFAELSLGRPPSPKKSHQAESSDRRDDFQERGGSMTEPYNPRMRVDFPRWEEGDPIGWISCAERYFQYHKTANASMVEIVTIHLEGDVIQWFVWFEHTHGVLSWRQFKEGLLNCFRPTDYENVDGHLAKIRQTSTIQEYQTMFERLSNQTRDWCEKQLLGTCIEGLKLKIQGEVKARQLYTLMAAISFG